MEQALFMAERWQTERTGRRYTQENGHMPGLAKPTQQFSSGERSKFKCLAHSVQSPKKWLLCLKRERERKTSKTPQGNNVSRL